MKRTSTQGLRGHAALEVSRLAASTSALFTVRAFFVWWGVSRYRAGGLYRALPSLYHLGYIYTSTASSLSHGVLDILH